MNKLRNHLLAIALCVSVVGCASFYGGVITVTSVVDSAMKSWSQLSVAGKTSADLDAKVKEAHKRYRQACSVTETALIAAGENVQSPDYVTAMVAARAVANELIDIITPLLEQKQAQKLEKNLAKASKL